MVRQNVMHLVHSRSKKKRKTGRRLAVGVGIAAALVGSTAYVRQINKRTNFYQTQGVANAKQWAKFSFNKFPISWKKFPLGPAEMKALNAIIEKAGITPTRGRDTNIERVLNTLKRSWNKALIEQYKNSGNARRKRIAIVWEKFDELPKEQQRRIKELLTLMEDRDAGIQ